jgi:hypothetical protein
VKNKTRVIDTYYEVIINLLSYYFSNMVLLYTFVAIIGSRHGIKCYDYRKIEFSRVWVGVKNFILVVQNCTKKST